MTPAPPRWSPVLALALALTGCPKDEPRPPDESDRTIQKLKAERARLEKAGIPQPTPALKAPAPDPLTEAAVKREPPVTLALPSTAPVQAGGVTFTLTGLESMQTVSGPKVSLATADRFLKVTLSAVAARETPLDLSAAKLVSGDQSFGVAKDVQRVGGGTALSSATAGTEPHDLVIFFEADASAIKKGLKLVLPVGDAGAVDVALQ